VWLCHSKTESAERERRCVWPVADVSTCDAGAANGCTDGLLNRCTVGDGERLGIVVHPYKVGASTLGGADAALLNKNALATGIGGPISVATMEGAIGSTTGATARRRGAIRVGLTTDDLLLVVHALRRHAFRSECNSSNCCFNVDSSASLQAKVVAFLLCVCRKFVSSTSVADCLR